MATPSRSTTALSVALALAFAAAAPGRIQAAAAVAAPATDRLPEEPEGVLTLDDAVALALARSPLLAASASGELARAGDVQQAGKVPNPELDVRVQNNAGAQPGDPDVQRLRLILRQEFELGGKRQRRIDLAESERAMAASDRAALRSGIEAAVRADFTELLGAERRVESARRFVDFDAELRDRVAGLVELGTLPHVRLQEVGRELGLARIDLREAESKLAASRYRLAAHWGSTTPRFSSAAGDLEAVAPIPDLDAVLAMAREAPGVARAAAELARGEAGLALARARRVPDLTYGVGVRWEDATSGRDYLVDVGIDIPIFDRNQGGIAAARHELERARAERAAAEARMAADVAAAYYELVEAEARRAILADEVVPAARSIFESQRIGFDSGAENLEDLYDARRRLYQAETESTHALEHWHRARATLEALVGGPLVPAD